jgi:hypothetical protein
MYLRFLLWLMLAVANMTIAMSALGILLVGADVLFLDKWGYPAWSLLVLTIGIAVGWATRAVIEAWLRDYP